MNEEIIKNMLGRREVLKILNVSNATFKKLIRNGELPTRVEGAGRRIYYDKQEVKELNEKLIEERKSKEITVETIKQRLKELYGYVPYEIYGEYKGIHTKMNVKCKKCGYEFEITPNNMLQSQSNARKKNLVPVCSNCNMGNNQYNTTIEEYQQKLDELFGINESYIVLEDTYINSDTKMKHKCKICNYEFEATPSNILYGKKKYNRHYCPKCNNMIRDTRDYNTRIKSLNIIALEEYKGRKIPILHKCLKCNHEWEAIPSNRLKGEGCPKCSNIIKESQMEIDIRNFLDSNNIKYETKNRKILSGKELDIYIPEHNLAIECNGIFWHSDRFKDKNYHINKTKECEEKGIQLIHIFEYEWNNKRQREILISKLKYMLKIKNNKKIYARKCFIEEIDSSIKNEFLESNHIQGKDSSLIKLGLWYKENDTETLVAVMTFCKPRRALGQKSNSQYDYELSRFATEKEYNVIGAFGKLFSYFKKNYEWNKIITYADKRYSKGNLYIKNGFTHLRDSKPNYFYIDRNTKKVYHRFNFRKQELRKKFPEAYSDDKTEFEIMDSLKTYLRIWDCGNMVFEYIKNEE